MLSLKKSTKINLNLSQHSSLRTAHVCAYIIIVHNHRTPIRTVLITFPLILQTIIIAQMISTAGDGHSAIKMSCTWLPNNVKQSTSNVRTKQRKTQRTHRKPVVRKRRADFVLLVQLLLAVNHVLNEVQRLQPTFTCTHQSNNGHRSTLVSRLPL